MIHVLIVRVEHTYTVCFYIVGILRLPTGKYIKDCHVFRHLNKVHSYIYMRTDLSSNGLNCIKCMMTDFCNKVLEN
jgi:hypothetical protein